MGDTMDEKVRAHVVISGRVQGVFFRMETKTAADNYNVSGWVRNTRDGNVDAVIEGDKENVDEMIQWCWRGSPLSRVNDVKVEWEEFKGEFETFGIRY